MKTLLLLSMKPIENIYTAIMQLFFVISYEKNVNKIPDSKSLTLVLSFQMRSCSEIDINILFVFNTKCIYPIGHFTWMFHPAKHQELILKVLAIFSFFTNFRRKRVLVRFSLWAMFWVRDVERSLRCIWRDWRFGSENK